MKRISAIIMFIGIVLSIVGHYEWRHMYSERPKIIYKFIDQWREEEHADNTKDIYNTFSPMFQDKSLSTF